VLSDTAPAFRLAIGFAGGIEDATTGLVRFGLRDYDPETGRWTSRDPSMFGGSPRNLYAYADNAPVSRRDPFGLLSIGGSAYVGIGGGGSLNVDGGGFGFCLEVGVGAGAGVEADLNGSAENSIAAFSEISAQAGDVGVTVTAERDPCKIDKPDKVAVKGTFGPAQAGFDSEGNINVGANTGIEAEIQAKAGVKQCWSWTWW
jgi:RHS repeat-associated protein